MIEIICSVWGNRTGKGESKMQFKEISEYKVYEKCEKEIREWLEAKYTGLSIEFYPHIEIVKTNKFTEYSKEQAEKVVDMVNFKLAEILEKHAEEIYIASLAERVAKMHPEYDVKIERLPDLKTNKEFLEYVKELGAKEETSHE